MVTYAGWELTVQWRTGSDTFKTLNGIQRITYTFSNAIEVKEECGTRYPTALVEGTFRLTGTIERFYTGSGFWTNFSYGISGSSGESAGPYIDVKISPGGTATGKPYVQLSGVKFNQNASSQRPAANLLIETWDFIGTGSISTGSN